MTIVTVYMKRDHFTRLVNLQNGSSNLEKKEKKIFEYIYFLPVLDLGPFN